ncbi:barstar family protein [Reyranella sp. CPCC 100927]|uniref:barstar family protein n=1 Tax=Reyranella sp. CPCC 100927 TaxID=2599616 RepID=UPI0011B5FA99|nr:barstar family protein [Reyranella sp. CPCC 100927]TWT00330.1 barstar family protein [Reyranella sp. CPCC 100927]
MRTTIVDIPVSRITNWDTFHDVFQEALGFPDFYGRNMNAWIDCMTYVDDPPSGMTTVVVGVGEVLTLRIDDAADLERRCPEQYQALIECTAFVNWRRVDAGGKPVIALMLTGYFQKD